MSNYYKKAAAKADFMFPYNDFISSIENFEAQYSREITPQEYFGFPLDPILRIENSLRSPTTKTIAYFSMEYGLAPSIYNSFQLKKEMSRSNQFFVHEVFSNYWLCDYLFKIRINKMLDIPIYGGGLGVLAGDTIKSATDQGLNFVGIGILWNKGYFKQKFWYKHGQIPDELKWDPDSYPGLIPLKEIVTIDTKEGPLHLRLWKYYVYSYDRTSSCPLILLDSNLAENQEQFQRLTDQLYRSDDVWWRIFQRLILGVGGMKALKALNYKIDCYHLNEGHAAFALVEKYLSLPDRDQMTEEKKNFAYTCHTPVLAGHDRFMIDEIRKVLTDEYFDAAVQFGKEKPDSNQINLTYLCLNHCHHVNGVAKKHGEIMRLQFPGFASKIKSITNGIHIPTWISQEFADLFDRYAKTIGDWRKNPENLVQVAQLKNNPKFRREIFEAHQVNKRSLIETLKPWQLKDDVLTISWARRMAGYKRPSLIFHNIEQLVKLAREKGPLQIILAGKAHPNDNIGSAHIEEMLDKIDQLNQYRDVIKVLMLENYDTYFGKLLTNSVDVWLNNPLPPFEASGTSGMKAIVNGVVQLTTLDGWVVEAADDNIGWIFGYQHTSQDLGSETDAHLEEDSQALYTTLNEVTTLYYQTCRKSKINIDSPWIDKMINCVIRSAFFNTHRMVKEYSKQMWEIL